MALDSTTARRLAQLVAVGRIGVGISALALPQLPLKPWVGDAAADDPSARLLARALGARDLALGLGAVLAGRDGGNIRGWVEAGTLADAGDTLITLGSFAKLPKGGRWMILAAAGGAAAVGGLTARRADG